MSITLILICTNTRNRPRSMLPRACKTFVLCSWAALKKTELRESKTFGFCFEIHFLSLRYEFFLKCEINSETFYDTIDTSLSLEILRTESFTFISSFTSSSSPRSNLDFSHVVPISSTANQSIKSISSKPPESSLNLSNRQKKNFSLCTTKEKH